MSEELELLRELRDTIRRLEERIGRLEEALGARGIGERVIAEEDGVRLIRTGDPFAPYVVEERLGDQVRIHTYKHLKTARKAFKYYVAKAKALH